jgi:hypothetical protein
LIFEGVPPVDDGLPPLGLVLPDLPPLPALAPSAGIASVDRAATRSLGLGPMLVGGVGASGDESLGIEPSVGAASLGGVDSVGVDSGASGGGIAFTSSAEFASVLEPPHATARANVEMKTEKSRIMKPLRRADRSRSFGAVRSALLGYRIVPHTDSIGKNAH